MPEPFQIMGATAKKDLLLVWSNLFFWWSLALGIAPHDPSTQMVVVGLSKEKAFLQITWGQPVEESCMMEFFWNYAIPKCWEDFSYVGIH